MAPLCAPNEAPQGASFRRAVSAAKIARRGKGGVPKGISAIRVRPVSTRIGLSSSVAKISGL